MSASPDSGRFGAGTAPPAIRDYGETRPGRRMQPIAGVAGILFAPRSAFTRY